LVGTVAPESDLITARRAGVDVGLRVFIGTPDRTLTDTAPLFVGDPGVNHTQNRSIDEVKNERRYHRLRPERQRERAMTA